MQYTLRNIPVEVDRSLREIARRENKSLNQVTIEALLRALGLTVEPTRVRELSDVAGTWQDDPEFDAVIADHDGIDGDLWR